MQEKVFLSNSILQGPAITRNTFGHDEVIMDLCTIFLVHIGCSFIMMNELGYVPTLLSLGGLTGWTIIKV
jgi:hypothetical protein